MLLLLIPAIIYLRETPMHDILHQTEARCEQQLLQIARINKKEVQTSELLEIVRCLKRETAQRTLGEPENSLKDGRAKESRPSATTSKNSEWDEEVDAAREKHPA